MNIKPLNSYIKYDHFKMENLETVRFLLREGDYMVKLDLQDAYLTVPVHHSHQKFLCFKWKSRFYQFSSLAFGLTSAPRVFTKIMKSVMVVFRKKGIRAVIYLDDILILNGSKDSLTKDVEFIVFTLQDIGFLINWDNSELKPCRVIEYLGVMVNSMRLSFALPQNKISALKLLCSSALRKDRISLRDMASILGNFTWAISAVPFAQSHDRRMQRFYLEKFQKSDANMESKHVLSAEAHQDLQWWIGTLADSLDKQFFPRTPDLEICADASLTGWGAYCNGVRTRGSWTVEDTEKHINKLELFVRFLLDSVVCVGFD